VLAERERKGYLPLLKADVNCRITIVSALNEQFERYNGDRLIEWLNAVQGVSFRYESRADGAPDLVYECSGNRLRVEVTAAYYDSEHAKFLWDGARGANDQSKGWVGANPDANLAREILERIKAKSLKDYGRGCLLLVVVPPGTTSYDALCNWLSRAAIELSSFDGIYVAGTFPNIDLDPATGGYRVITIKAWDGTHVVRGR
jgi:hypothetical protein